MAVIHPFRALKPNSEIASEVACVPYDVISTNEARQMARGNPRSFLHVIRPEIDLPPDTPWNDERVYRKGAENLEAFMEKGVLQRDDRAAIYLYRLIREGRTQTGIFSCVSVDEYDRDIIRKHELTRPDKEDDRTRHILTQEAHAEPVMLTFRSNEQIRNLMETAAGTEPETDFIAGDGVRHTLWRIPETERWTAAFEEIPRLYIADGHHRCKSASRAAERKADKQPGHSGKEEYNFFPAVLFPMDNMQILSYNRIIHRVPDQFLDTLKSEFGLERTDDPVPDRKGMVCLHTGEGWWRMELPEDEDPNRVEQLDAYRLQAHILEPLLGIEDPRRDDNISFVGGIRGTEELERLVGNGEAALAVSMYPTGIEELASVADEGMLMPPKSTWFEPKLRSGLLVHTF